MNEMPRLSLSELRGAIEQAFETELNGRKFDQFIPEKDTRAVESAISITTGWAKVVAADLAVVLVSEVLHKLNHSSQFVARREDHIMTDHAAAYMNNAIACIIE